MSPWLCTTVNLDLASPMHPPGVLVALRHGWIEGEHCFFPYRAESSGSRLFSCLISHIFSISPYVFLL